LVFGLSVLWSVLVFIKSNQKKNQAAGVWGGGGGRPICPFLKKMVWFGGFD
jgi:hypothetical protein